MKKIINSFSAGETSGYMSWYLNVFKKNEYDVINVFMNTGEENEETLIFADKCDKEFNMNLVYIEAVVNPIKGKGTRHKIVDFKTASRNGEPFFDVVKKYTLPSVKWTHCSRETKQRTLTSFIRDNDLKNVPMAIGIRADEIDRISEDRHARKIVYPLIELGVEKPDVNTFWRDMPFRLPIKGYEGNCKVCFKKSLRKLLTIAKYHPEYFDNFKKMELMFPELRAFRGNLSSDDIIKLSKEPFEEAEDDRLIYKESNINGINLDTSGGCIESCEVF